MTPETSIMTRLLHVNGNPPERADAQGNASMKDWIISGSRSGRKSGRNKMICEMNS